MQLVTKIVAGYLVIVGLAVFLNLIATPLYHDGGPDYPVWKILNWFMAVAVLIILVVGFLRKRVLDSAGEDGASTLDQVRGSFVFYGGVVLAMLFFWEWFWTLNPDSETSDGAVTSHLVYFPLVDSLLTVLAFIVGKRMWRAGDGSQN
ncbi:MAG: hypothetical protein F4X72_14125 [Dehalococcoidia bacterium]|nr:hypothetical protein [Dehalococcoidia bacterium]